MEQIRIYSDAPCVTVPKVSAEIDLGSLKSNYKVLASFAPKARHIAVVKADAYGHTSALCVPALLEVGCDFFAVSCIEEALAVKKICIELSKEAEVLILGYTDPAMSPVLAEYGIIQSVVSREHGEKLASFAEKYGLRVRAHIAVDTGMNRIGLKAVSETECRYVADEIARLAKRQGLLVEGMFTHFSRADEDFEASDGEEFTKAQFKKFDLIRAYLLEDGIKLFCHASNSAAALRFPEFDLDGVRLGIVLYGANPSKYAKAPVSPVMSLKTVVSRVHTIKKGEVVGYGGTYVAESDGVIATLPIGYADGFMRAFSGAPVTVHTKKGEVKATVVGRICMDQCMIDVSGSDVEVGDTVTVFGRDPADLCRLAVMASTIEYEVLCLVSARVPRIAKESGVDTK